MPSPVTYIVNGNPVGFFQRAIANKTFAAIAAAVVYVIYRALNNEIPWSAVGTTAFAAVIGVLFKAQSVKTELAGLAANPEVSNVRAVRKV